MFFTDRKMFSSNFSITRRHFSPSGATLSQKSAKVFVFGALISGHPSTTSITPRAALSERTDRRARRRTFFGMAIEKSRGEGP